MKTPVLNESPGLRYFAFFYLYIMQGIPAGITLTAISNYLLGKNVEPQQVGTFIVFVGLPWTLQFVWGPLIDRYRYSPMGHRRHTNQAERPPELIRLSVKGRSNYTEK